MSKTQHTPGPWTVDMPYIWGPKHEMVADLHDDMEAGMVARVRGTGAQLPQEANAHLIAAVPELLDALVGCMRAIDRLCYKHDPDSIEYEWVGHAHEAIIKAKDEHL